MTPSAAEELRLPFFCRMETLITPIHGGTSAKLRLDSRNHRRRCVNLFDRVWTRSEVGARQRTDVRRDEASAEQLPSGSWRTASTDSLILAANELTPTCWTRLYSAVRIVLRFELPRRRGCAEVIRNHLRPMKYPESAWRRGHRWLLLASARAELAKAADEAANVAKCYQSGTPSGLMTSPSRFMTARTCGVVFAPTKTKSTGFLPGTMTVRHNRHAPLLTDRGIQTASPSEYPEKQWQGIALSTVVA